MSTTPPDDTPPDASVNAPPPDEAPVITAAALRSIAPGSRLENAWLAMLLVLDLLSIPYHVLAFLLTRRRHREAFRHTLKDAAA